jgi:methionyl-tRNA formyltransferase
VVCHPGKSVVRDLAEEKGLLTIIPENPNDKDVQKYLRSFDSDLFVLAAYGKILKQDTIDIPKLMCINLHGGRLPEYRGSSPMNWSLINDESCFGLSIIKVDAGVDTGDVLLEKVFDISETDTICDLHAIANEQFPLMLAEAVEQIANETFELQKQNEAKACYYPLRFPDDGLILWDIFTAKQIYNRIRALTEPYPCAFSFYNTKEVKLISAQLFREDFFGEPGRIYRKHHGKLLVCASDRCLWITEARFKVSEESLYDSIGRYEKLATVRDAIAAGIRIG